MRTGVEIPPPTELRTPIIIGSSEAATSPEVELITRSGRVVPSLPVPSQGESSKPKEPTNEEVRKVIHTIKGSDYNIIEQLRKQPAQISLFDLIHSSDKHREMLERFLADVHVPEHVEVNALDSYMNGMLAVNAITFSDEDLPEGRSDHNSALFITLRCRDTTVSKVLIDGGSGVNIVPLAVAEKLGISLSKLPASSMTIRAFDGAKRQAHGEVTLEIKVGPTMFSSVFQVLETAGSFNMLLGRPWIHQAGAIPSTLHQMVRFPADGKLITVKGEHTLELCHEIDMPYVGDPAGEPSTAQALEMVNMVKKDFKSDALMDWGNVRAAKVLIKYGYQPGQGLGAHRQGVREPVIPHVVSRKLGLGADEDTPRRPYLGAHDLRNRGVSYIPFVLSSARTLEGELMVDKMQDMKIEAHAPEEEINMLEASNPTESRMPLEG